MAASPQQPRGGVMGFLSGFTPHKGRAGEPETHLLTLLPSLDEARLPQGGAEPPMWQAPPRAPRGEAGQELSASGLSSPSVSTACSPGEAQLFSLPLGLFSHSLLGLKNKALLLPILPGSAR